MRKIVGLAVIAVFLGAFAFADLSQAAPAAPIKWKLQSAHPAGAPQIELLNKMVCRHRQDVGWEAEDRGPRERRHREPL